MDDIPIEDAWKAQLEGLGDFIRNQRKLANFSLRQLAAVTKVSNAYLSQIERGLHEPSVRVLRSIASALDIQTETLLAQAGLVDKQGGATEAESDGGGGGGDTSQTEAAIRNDPNLSDEQKVALLSVYRSYRDRQPPEEPTESERGRIT